MRARVAIPLIAVLGLSMWAWRAELFHVARGAPRPLVARPVGQRANVAIDVVLPVVPAGMQRVRAGDEVLLIHYWAPWERHSRDQAQALDSLRRDPSLLGLRMVIACSDPFPSVARYVARQRLRLPVLLDGPGELRKKLPCPSIPYTYVIDRSGRIAVSQAGEVDWWSPQTLATLRTLLEASPGRSPTAHEPGSETRAPRTSKT